MKRIAIVLGFVALALVIAPTAAAHPGRTDAKGGHTCRTNCTERWGLKYGQYHKHGAAAKTAKTTGKTTAKTVAKTGK